MYIRRIAAAACAAFLLIPSAAAAQSVSIGPHMSFVRPDPALGGTASDRYTGGTLRLQTSPRTSIELSMDWRSTINDDATVRISDYPFQGSLLLYPVRAAIAPYVLGGVGWYSQRMESMLGSEVLSQQTVRRMGYHGGVGGEMKLGKRASIFADYRYTFIRFGGDETTVESGAGAGPLALGLSGLSLLENFKMSHEGSMWIGGVVIRF